MNERFDFLGVKISVINLNDALDKIISFPFNTSTYICFPDTSVIAEASESVLLMNILNNSFLTMPDGKPSQIVGNLKGHKKVKTVSGFHLCNALLTTSLTHYFYGANKEVLMKIKNNLNSSFPNATILGFKEAPFVDENQIKNNLQIKKDIDHINSLKPDLIWIGLSSPKQDYLMHYFYHDFNKSLLLGVGGVFLYLSDEKMKSPEWVKKIGFRWLYRLAKEPARLGPKVFRTLKFLFSNFFYFTSLLSTFLKKTITQKNAN